MRVILSLVGSGGRDFRRALVRRALGSRPAVFEKFMPCAFCDAAHLIVGQLARGKEIAKGASLKRWES